MRHRTLPALAMAFTALAACSSDGTTDESSDAVETTAPADTEPETAPDTTPDTTPDTAPDTTEAAPDTTPDTTEATPDTTVAPAPAPAGEDIRAIADQAEQPHGSNVITSTVDFTATVDAVRSAIEGNDALTLVAEIDHAANAESVDLELGPATVFLFGNPALGTPLMQENQSTAIDLPQRMLVTEDVDGTVQIWWNDPTFIASRHGLGPASVETIATIDGALAGLASTAAATGEEATYAFPTIGVGDGVIAVDADGTAAEVVERIVAAIEENDALSLLATIDHAANAASVGSELPPTVTLVFGNPNLGTPLMRESRTFGLDLPQKMTVIETDSGVQILYNDPAEFANRHDIDTDAEPIPTIAGALESLATSAASGG